MEASDRPLSAITLDYRTPPNRAPALRRSASGGGDVEMSDVGPSTAPQQQPGRGTCFHDD